MDNTKNDHYYLDKIKTDLAFIVEHMKDVDLQELNENEVLLDSMMFRMIQVSENAKKLSTEYKETKKCKNGNIYTGVNCDGIHGSCAEYITMGIAISAGEREFDTIVAVHNDFPNEVIAPCGNCRQMLIEYCPDIKVILNDYENNLIKVGIKDLLPFACL